MPPVELPPVETRRYVIVQRCFSHGRPTPVGPGHFRSCVTCCVRSVEMWRQHGIPLTTVEAAALRSFRDVQSAQRLRRLHLRCQVARCEGRWGRKPNKVWVWRVSTGAGKTLAEALNNSAAAAAAVAVVVARGQKKEELRAASPCPTLFTESRFPRCLKRKLGVVIVASPPSSRPRRLWWWWRQWRGCDEEGRRRGSGSGA